MNTEKNSSHDDVTYPMPDAAEAYAKAGAAFQGAAWINDSAYKQSDEVLAAAAQLAEQHPVEKTITADDVAAIAASIRQHCMASGVPMAEIDKICSRILGSVGAPKSQLDDLTNDARAAAADAINTARDDYMQFAQNADLQFEANLNQFNILEKEAKKEFEKLSTTDEEKKRRAELEKELEDAQKLGDKQAIADAAKAIGQFDQETGHKYDPNGELEKTGKKEVTAAETLEIDAKKITFKDGEATSQAEVKATSFAEQIAATQKATAQENKQAGLPETSNTAATSSISNAVNVNLAQSGSIPSQQVPQKQVASADKGPSVSF